MFRYKGALKWNVICPKIRKTVSLNKFKKAWRTNSSGVSHSDGSCVLGRIHSDVSSNIPKKVYHIVTANFVNLLHISTHDFIKPNVEEGSFMPLVLIHTGIVKYLTNFDFIFDTICVPYIFRKSIFGWNCDHDTPLCDTPVLEDTPLCDTPDEFINWFELSCLCLTLYDVCVLVFLIWTFCLICVTVFHIYPCFV